MLAKDMSAIATLKQTSAPFLMRCILNPPVLRLIQPHLEPAYGGLNLNAPLKGMQPPTMVGVSRAVVFKVAFLLPPRASQRPAFLI